MGGLEQIRLRFFIGRLICTERYGASDANTMHTPSLHEDMELRDTTVGPGYGSGVMGERCISVLGFSNHALAQGQLSSSKEIEGGRRKIY